MTVTLSQDQTQKILEDRHTTAHVLNAIIDGVIIIDAQGVIRLVNPAACRIFHYQEADLINQKINCLMPQPHQAIHDSYLKNYFQRGSGKITNRNLELTGLRRSGEEFPIEISVTEILIHEEVMFIGLLRDISERKEYEKILFN